MGASPYSCLTRSLEAVPRPAATGSARRTGTVFSVGYRQGGLARRAPHRGLRGAWPWPGQPGIPGTGGPIEVSASLRFSTSLWSLSALGQWVEGMGWYPSRHFPSWGTKWQASVVSMLLSCSGCTTRQGQGVWTFFQITGEDVTYFTNHTVAAIPGTSQKPPSRSP